MRAQFCLIAARRICARGMRRARRRQCARYFYEQAVDAAEISPAVTAGFGVTSGVTVTAGFAGTAELTATAEIAVTAGFAMPKPTLTLSPPALHARIVTHTRPRARV